ncbi:hypothetical protein PybrP1_011736, partial [[Pythium] brassicae (nom. inval.)]
DAALARRFQSVLVPEPSVEDTVTILRLLFTHHCRARVVPRGPAWLFSFPVFACGRDNPEPPTSSQPSSVRPRPSAGARRRFDKITSLVRFATAVAPEEAALRGSSFEFRGPSPPAISEGLEDPTVSDSSDSSDSAPEESDSEDARSERAPHEASVRDGDRAADDDEVRAASAAHTPPSHPRDPWSSVLWRMAKKAGASSSSPSQHQLSTPPSASASSNNARLSLARVLKSRGVKNLVQQAAAASALASASRRRAGPSDARSAVMEHWVKTARLRKQTALADESEQDGDRDEEDDDADADNDNDDDDEDAALGIESGFDVRGASSATSRQLYGRTLLLEESCRRALAQRGENRSAADLQALRAWLALTKLKITTNLERLQPAELDLLCRRMTRVAFHPREVVFRQGDDGDALYLVFAGVVEVRVGQRVVGEHVEVTVCELAKGDYFGERSLLSNAARAATVVAKTAVELVCIAREDYDLLLRTDQLAFLSRLQMANGLGAAGAGSTPASSASALSAATAQQSQRAYVRVLAKKKGARTKSDVEMLGAYLATLKFFRALPATFVRELCAVVDLLSLPPGATVFREGEVGDLFYIVFAGSVDVVVGSRDGRGKAQQTKLINLTEGAHFGELALMKGHGIRSATVVTREASQLLVICERDYNATLRRMQKEDLAKRVGVLDQIPVFQTPAWTGELLKEMSYVLAERKLHAGAVLFAQGDKALQLFFVVRGELVATKDIVDLATRERQTVLVERIGRFRVVGDDAASGATFNEVLFREVTVTASTPVEVLVLSKYDVFHRLSRAAREALRAAAHAPTESIVYLDRLRKTDTWGDYKQRVLREHTNHERLAKILPPQRPLDAAPQQAVGKIRTPRATTRRQTEAQGATSQPTPKTTPSLQSNVLVDANEFLLLPPVDSGARTPLSTRTIGHFVSTFNADAPPSSARQHQLADVLTAEHRRAVRTLNEGNPLAYFDLHAVKRQEKRHNAESRGRAVSTRRTLLINVAGLAGGAHGAPTAVESSPLPTLNALSSAVESLSELPARTTLTNTVATNVMNQLGLTNFVFSRPAQLSASKGGVHCKSSGAESTPSSRKVSAMLRVEAEHLCDGDFVVVRVTTPDDESERSDPSASTLLLRTLRSPVVCILAAAASLAQAREVAQREQTKDALQAATRDRQSCSGEPSDVSVETTALDAATFYLLPKRKFAVLPRTTRPRAVEEQLQAELWERFARAPTALSSTSGSTSASSSAQNPHGRRPSIAVSAGSSGFPERSVSTAPAALTTTPRAAVLESPPHFASFQKIVPTMTELHEITSAQQQQAAATHTYEEPSSGDRKPPAPEPKPEPEPAAPRLFAVVSVILSKQEIANSVCDEPFLCVHGLFPSEALATDAALHVAGPLFRNALLCVVPVGEHLHLEDAYEWCVQIETDRREKRGSSAQSVVLSPNRTKALAAQSSRLGCTNAKAGGIGSAATSSNSLQAAGRDNIAGPVSPARAPDWQIEREKAHRLHQFICSRLSHKATVGDKERQEQQEASGFTPTPLLTLEDKLSTLHEYLESSNAAALAGARGGAGVSGLGKFRHVKRFGSIMRARIGSTLATSGLSPNLLTTNGSNNGSVAPASSTSPVAAAPPS